MKRKPVDWEKLEKDYRAGEFATKAAMAERYGCSTTAINKKAKKEGWPIYEPRSEVLEKVSKKPPAKPHEKILGPIAMRKIDELKNELGEHYSSVDEPLIVSYAKSYERYLDLEKRMVDEDVIAYSSKTGSAYIHPLFNAIQMTQKTLVTLAGQLGLSIASRKKLGINFNGEDGKRTQSLFDIAGTINNMDVDV
ncbi:P27 family phage terminase small subunit [Sulfurimonas sp. HSL1-6]|uniref:P27 family phage terminase small subunit n=1 Tax=Thiomicrolovo immobilis TaxID=3131935 RepID=UPI0031F93B12